MKICIVGGGHIGTTLACYIKHYNKDWNVAMYTRKQERFSEKIKCNDIENKKSYEVILDTVSSNPEIAAKDADVVFVALPHFAVEKAFSDISQYVSSKVYIVVLPGCGGCEFIFDKYFDDKKTLVGFQRVPFTAKLVEYGKETNLKSWKPFSVVGTLKRERIDDACMMIEQCGLKTRKASNYLEIALTPSNPILHSARTFELFGHYNINQEFETMEKFYVGWSDETSRLLFGMDNELHQLLDSIDELDTTAIRPLSEHYESPTVEALTKKINSIPTFQTVFAPYRKKDNGKYVADVSSRMFTEDFPWGLVVFKSYCNIFGIETPTMDMVLKWYAEYMGIEYYIGNDFCGRDLEFTGYLGRYGISSKKELISFYLK